MALQDIYQPAQDEASRHAFVGTLKAYVNGRLEERLDTLYEETLSPAFAAQHGRKPASREEASGLLTGDPLFQMWASLVYSSQDLMWEAAGETIDRIRPEVDRTVNQLVQGNARLGSLTLDPKLVIPQPIADVEIHRQPGGFFHQDGVEDVTAAMLNLGAGGVYGAAKRQVAQARPGDPVAGRALVDLARKLAPTLEPRRILELGCGIGSHTVALAQAWPEAEVHGLDLSAPLVRFAHAWAEDNEVGIHYHQMDASATNFPEGHFDLIVSVIFCHETSHDILRRSMAQAYRMLAPGGLLLNIDVPYQPSRTSLVKQVTNEWQVANNGEPFWMGFADTEMKRVLMEAGFAEDEVIDQYQPNGRSSQYVFGGIKRA